MGLITRIIRRYQGYLQEYASEDVFRKICNLLEKNSDATLLDLGCYDGGGTMNVARYVGTKKIYGIDMINEALEKARKKGIITLDGDLNKRFPLEDNVADVVYSNQVIEHLINLDNFAREIYRVLKPGGYAVVSTENLASWHNLFALVLGYQPFSSKLAIGNPLTFFGQETPKKESVWHPSMAHNKVLAYRALIELFEQHGFTIIRICGAGYYPFPKFVGQILASINPSHAAFLAIKVKKPARIGVGQHLKP